jgi:hypothetical protein
MVVMAWRAEVPPVACPYPKGIGSFCPTVLRSLVTMAHIDWTTILAARGLEAPGYQETKDAAHAARDALKQKAAEDLILKQQQHDEKVLQQAYREAKVRKRKR